MSSETTENRSFSKIEKKEFEMLVAKNMRRAYYSALGLLGSHDAAMDLSQEAFIRAYKNYDKFDERRNFFSWYYKILKNLCLNFIRDKKRRKEEPILEYRNDELENENPQETVEKNELTELIQEALSELEFEEREIIVLREFEDYSYNEIADMLNIPAGTVMSRLYYARKKLAGKLKRMMI
ncbi:ECF RNA polymerase sigma factor SigW [bacterium BMS3Abin03]|nr:ECF RNA polymerase sigma factor SigW [bacterium BMS3Abin03]